MFGMHTCTSRGYWHPERDSNCHLLLGAKQPRRLQKVSVPEETGHCILHICLAQHLMCWHACMQTFAIWKVTWRLFLGALPFKLVNDAATFVGPLFLNLLLGVVSEGKSSAVGYSYAGLMFVGLVIGTLCDNQHFQRVMRAGAAHSAGFCSNACRCYILCPPCHLI